MPDATNDTDTLSAMGSHGLEMLSSDLANRAAQKAYDMRATQLAREMVAAEDYAKRVSALTLQEPVTLEEMLATSHVDDGHLIDRVIPRAGKFLIGAQEKAGKTTVVANAVRSLVTGKPFLGEFETDTRGNNLRVHVIDTEMTVPSLDRAFRNMAMPDAALRRVTYHPAMGRAALLDPRVPASRSLWVERLRGADVVILDCMSPVLAALGMDENREAGDFLVPFDELMTEADVKSWGVVHHMGHHGERVRGDSRILGWTHQTLNLLRDSDDPDAVAAPRYVKTYGRMGEIPTSQVVLDVTTNLLTYRHGFSRKRAKAERAAQEGLELVLRAVEEKAVADAWVTSGQVAEWTAQSQTTVLKYLRAGVTNGRAECRENPKGRGQEFRLVERRDT